MARPLLNDDLPMAEWQRLRNLQVQGRLQDHDGWLPERLSDDLPMEVWQQVRNRQARGESWSPGQVAPMRAVALAAPAGRAPTEVEGVVVVGRKAPEPAAPKAAPVKGPLKGRPGIAAIVAGGLNTIASGPNTSARIDDPSKESRVSGTVTRGAGRDVRASGTVDIPVLGRHAVGAEGVLDPPTGRAEISASQVKGSAGIGLPSRIRVYTTPSGELDVHLPKSIKVGGIPVVPAGTYVIGTPDPKRAR